MNNLTQFLTGLLLTSVLSGTAWAGECVIPQVRGYDGVDCLKEGLAAVSNYDKIGYINKTGKIVIPFQFDYGGEFSEGKALVENDGELFYINKQGKRLN